MPKEKHTQKVCVALQAFSVQMSFTLLSAAEETPSEIVSCFIRTIRFVACSLFLSRSLCLSLSVSLFPCLSLFLCDEEHRFLWYSLISLPLKLFSRCSKEPVQWDQSNNKMRKTSSAMIFPACRRSFQVFLEDIIGAHNTLDFYSIFQAFGQFNNCFS